MPSFISILAAGAASVAMTTSAPTTDLTASSIAAIAVAQVDMATINAPYNAFLSKYVVNDGGINLVRYGDVTAADKAAIKAYVAALERISPASMSRNDQLAYYFNIYNAKTIELILDNYPVRSIRQIGGGVVSQGPWKQDVLTIDGKRLSLDDIEHETVRTTYDEPRVHYAFNCASMGCPNIKTSAWRGSTLDQDLDAAARDFVNHPRGVRVEGNKVIASSIYRWFQKDFGRSDKDVLEHLRKYATGSTAEMLRDVTRINSYDYDWSLNEAK